MSREDFERLRDLEIEEHRWSHNVTRDLFLFACYTGTSYIDAVSVTPDNLSKDDDGALLLKYQRGKNGKLSRVKLLPEAIELIDKYHSKSRKTLLPHIEHAALMWNLSSLRVMAGIKGPLTYQQVVIRLPDTFPKFVQPVVSALFFCLARLGVPVLRFAVDTR